jgi:transcriptional regulator GlxA family with amidase domain
MEPKRVIIVLVPGFSHLSLGAISESLYTLNNISDDTEIIVDVATISHAEVASAAGLQVHCPLSFQACCASLRSARKPDALFLCCGLRTPFESQADIQNLLRLCVRSGVPLYGLGCAAWKMADAGILENGRGTVHWKTLAAFAERNRSIDARDALFVASDQVTSSPGEAAALDLAVEFIRNEFSPDHAERVCSHLLISFPRRGDLKQPRGSAERLRDVPERLGHAISLMSDNLEDPLTVTAIAETVGLSMRQIERLFSAHLSVAPKKYYMTLRLQHARQLIEQTSMSILEISVASGFSNRRVLTHYYKKEFGFPPTHTRRTP